MPAEADEDKTRNIDRTLTETDHHALALNITRVAWTREQPLAVTAPQAVTVGTHKQRGGLEARSMFEQHAGLQF